MIVFFFPFSFSHDCVIKETQGQLWYNNLFAHDVTIRIRFYTLFCFAWNAKNLIMISRKHHDIIKHMLIYCKSPPTSSTYIR